MLGDIPIMYLKAYDLAAASIEVRYR